MMFGRSCRIALLGLIAVPLAVGAAPGIHRDTSAMLLRRLCFTCGSRLDSLRLDAVETWKQAGAKGVPTSETDAVFFHHGVPIEVELTHDGRELSPRAHAAQLRQSLHLEHLIDRAAPESAGPLLNLAGEVWTITRFETEYSWRELPPAQMDGKVCTRLAFTPKPGLHPHSRLERIVSRTEGELDVDPATGQVLAGSFRSLGPVGFGGGLLARFSAFHGTFTMQPVPGSTSWVLRRAVVEVRGRELFHHVNGTETMTYAIR
ncbi:MAG: hypothetical protein ACRD2D_05635 [Terriglobales bacterium]